MKEKKMNNIKKKRMDSLRRSADTRLRGNDTEKFASDREVSRSDGEVSFIQLMEIRNSCGFLPEIPNSSLLLPNFQKIPLFGHLVYDLQFIVNRKLRSLLWHIVVHMVHAVNQMTVFWFLQFQRNDLFVKKQTPNLASSIGATSFFASQI